MEELKKDFINFVRFGYPSSVIPRIKGFNHFVSILDNNYCFFDQSIEENGEITITYSGINFIWNQDSLVRISINFYLLALNREIYEAPKPIGELGLHWYSGLQKCSFDLIKNWLIEEGIEFWKLDDNDPEEPNYGLEIKSIPSCRLIFDSDKQLDTLFYSVDGLSEFPQLGFRYT